MPTTYNAMTLETLFKGMTNAPYLFIGSGFTRRYCNSPGWENLLKQLASEVRPELPYPLKSFEAEVGMHLPKEQRFPKVASLIEAEYNRRFFEGALEPTPALSGTDFNVSALTPFRVRLSEIFSAVTKSSSLEEGLQEELSDFKVAMQHSLNGIITTNYDGFVESVFDRFKPYVGQDDLIFSRAVGLGEIYKIHGCYKQPNSLIFTEEDYVGFERRKAYLVAKLLSIFMENPIVFFGYSASDTDIKGIFTSIAQCLDAEHLRQLGQRIILVDYQPHIIEPEVVPRDLALEEGRTITIHQIKTGDFRPICKRLLKVRRTYDVQLLRRAKEDLYQTILSNQPTDVIQVLGEHAVFDSEESATPQSVIGFTLNGHSGHVVLRSEDVYRHVLLNDGPIDLKSFVENWLPEKMGRCEYPVYGFVRAYQAQFGGVLAQPLLDFMETHKKLDDFIPKDMRDRRKSRPYSLLEDILSGWNDVRNGYNKILLLDEGELRKPQLWEFLRELVQQEPSLLTQTSTSTPLKRLIRVCDFLRNASTAPVAECGAENGFAQPMR